MKGWIDCNEAGVCTVAASLVINLATGQPQFNPVLLGLARKPPILDAEMRRCALRSRSKPQEQEVM